MREESDLKGISQPGLLSFQAVSQMPWFHSPQRRQLSLEPSGAMISAGPPGRFICDEDSR